MNTKGLRSYRYTNLKQDLSNRGDHALKMLSDLSGGKYFPIVEYQESIANEIQQLTGNYYVLGYYVGGKWDGKYHKIQVKVNRKECSFYVQKGYYNPKPFSEFSELEKELDLLALATGGRSYIQELSKFSSIAKSI